MRFNKSHVYLPLAFALIPAIVIILLLPPMFERYKLISEEHHTIQKDNAYITYHDLNHDGNLELIMGIDSEIGTASILIYKHDGELVGQYNYPGKFPLRNNSRIWIDNYNNDRLSEIYFFTHRQDSAFLQILAVNDETAPVFEREVFIDTVRSTKTGIRDYGTIIYELIDINNDSSKEILFSVNAYYTHFPRKVGLYNIANQKLTYSDNFAAKPHIQFIKFRKGEPVLRVATSAHANIEDPNPYYGSDFNSQLFLLNRNLEVIQGPATYSEYHGTKYHTILPERKQIFTISIPDKAENNKTRVITRLFDYHLNIIKQNSFLLPDKIKAPLRLNCKNGLAYGSKNKFFFIDYETLQHTQTFEFKFPLSRETTFLNLDTDSQKETVGINSSNIYVIEDDMKTITTSPANLSPDNKTYFSKIPGEGNQNRFLVQNQNEYAVYAYQENEAYVFQYPLYLLIYLLSAVFIYGITTITRRNAQKKYRLEREMLNLQLKSTRNQASPHFTYNLLNAISSAILHEEKKKAHSMVTSMGQLMRSSLENSEKIERTLKEELEFVDNFLSLEKQRFNGTLNYELEIADDVNTEIPVPKMLLQIFVENAIKHGIQHLMDRKGKVSIIVLSHQERNIVKITDNGIGRKAAKKHNAKSSKTGLKIVDKIVQLHKKLNDYEIDYEIKDLYHDNNQPAGTQVIINIPQKQ